MTTPEHRTLDTERLARRVHNALIEDLAKIQRELAELYAVEALFKDHALPTNSILRSGHDTLTDAVKARGRQAEHLWERHGTLLAEISILEDLLIRADKEDMQEFGRAMAERFRQAQAEDRKKKRAAQ